MSNILSYGFYFPHFHVEEKILSPRYGRKGKRIVSYVDEDIITLSFEAVENCFSKIKNSKAEVDAILFATTSSVFHNRYHASFLADLLNLPKEIHALDFASTPRAGTDALIYANQMINAGIYKKILIVASDIHFPPIGEEPRNSFGHSAVAFILGNEGGVAEITSTNSFSSSIAEEFIYKNEKITYDPRYSRDAGFKHNTKSALEKIKVNAGDYDAVILNSLYAKLAGGIFFKAGFSEEQFAKDTVTSNYGYTSVCHALLQLIFSLEKKNILLFDYFNGTNIITIRVQSTPSSSERVGVRLESEGISYHDYLTLRKAGNFNSLKYDTKEMFSSEMMQEREKDTLQYLKGLKCDSCGTIYYLKSTRCKKCKCEKFTDVQLATTGTVYTLTSEHYFPTSFPPINMLVIDLDNGGRITVQQTDTMYPENNKIEIGSKVKLVLRKMMENDEKPNYFWKAIALRITN